MDKRAILADLTKIDFQQPKRIQLGTSYSFSVGGIGDVRQTAFRFKKYHFDEKLNRIVPDYDLEDLTTWNMEHGISGQDLLVSLMNLYDSINRPGISDIPYTEQIMKWCSEYFHPYNYDDILASIAIILADGNVEKGFEALNELADEDARDSLGPIFDRLVDNHDIAYSASFDVDLFMEDLRNLCDAFTAYLAMAANERGDSITIENMIYKGKHFSFPGFLYQFVDRNGHCIENVSISEMTLWDFADMFPTMNLKLQYMREDGITVIAPVVKSVFDTCWYALSCMAAAAESEGYGRGRYRFIRCKCCNQLISAYGQQKYCQSAACQAFRNSQKMQTHRSKKKRQMENEAERDT